MWILLHLVEQYDIAACLNVLFLLLHLNRRTSFCLREGQGTSRWLTLGQAVMNSKEVRRQDFICNNTFFLTMSGHIKEMDKSGPENLYIPHGLLSFH